MTPADTPVISAWSAISPWGLGNTAFTDGLLARRPTAAALDPTRWDVPVEQACLVPGFDLRQVLGRKGTRTMDRVTGLAVAAIGNLLTTATGERLSGVDEHAGLTLGTNTGSAQSMAEFTRDSLTGERPYLVEPAHFPNTVMNCAAGHSAIWHRVRGPNTTVAGGRASGLLALRNALRLRRAGRAEVMLCGAVEEFSRTRAWLEWQANQVTKAVGGDLLLGEGAAVWLLEPAEAARHARRPALAEVAGIELGFSPTTQDIPPTLGNCLRRLLERTGVRPDQVAALAPAQAAGIDGEAERDALTDLFGVDLPEPVPCAELIGDTYAASAAFQLTALLAHAGTLTGAAGRHLLATSAETNGVAGAALLRLPDNQD